MSRAITFSVFTPTFNRKHTLSRVYECLLAQTVQDFEWVIIDDGSTDGTEDLVRTWQPNTPFPIIYKWQVNQGKHIAYNTAAGMIRGELFTSIDSDDEIVPEALETLSRRWAAIESDTKERLAGMTFISKDQHGNIVGDLFPQDGEIVDLMEIILVRKIMGEKGGFVRSSVLRMYPFPEDVKNVYVPESIFMQRMARDWKTICVNEVLRIYWIDERPDHLGEQMKTRKNYPGDRLNSLSMLNNSMRFFWRLPKIFLGNAVLFGKISFYLGKGIRVQAKELKPGLGKALWLFGLPLSYVLYLREKSNRETH